MRIATLLLRRPIAPANSDTSPQRRFTVDCGLALSLSLVTAWSGQWALLQLAALAPAAVLLLKKPSHAVAGGIIAAELLLATAVVARLP